MRRASLIAIAITLAPVVADAQAAWCTPKHKAQVIRVSVVNCGDPKQLTVRRRGDDQYLITLALAAPGIWEKKINDSSPIESNRLCSTFCGYASSCVEGTPVPDTDKDGNDICVAEYTFRCDEPAWTLSVLSNPLITLDWTRRRVAAATMEQRGILKAAPGTLCDLAADEQIKLKPKLPPTSQFTFRDIPVSQADLRAQEHNTLILGSNDLVKYVIPPEGHRTQPLSDYEKEYLKLDLRQLTLVMIPETK